MKTVLGTICIIIVLISTLSFCQHKKNTAPCPHYKYQKDSKENTIIFSFVVFYASNAIDTINVECYDYGIHYGRRNGICHVSALVDDTAYCENCRVYYIREIWQNVCTTSAPVKVLK